MYKKIMVPLDGSPTAEITLPYVTELAIHFDSEIILLSVVEPGVTVTESLFRSYLNAVSARIRANMQARGIINPLVRIKILSGNPTTEIIRNVDIDGIDLIIMASRGSSVESEWVLGNIAMKIVRIATKPVMLIKHAMKDRELYQKIELAKILVPLDGSRVGEAAIPHAVAIAQQTEAEIVLFHVVEPAPWPISNDMEIKARDQNAGEMASVYLDGIVKELSKKGLKVVSQIVR